MNEKEIKKLAEKCQEIRNKIIDNEFKEPIKLKKYVKKQLNKTEIEELAVQFILKEALEVMLREMNEAKSMSEKDLNMYA